MIIVTGASRRLGRAVSQRLIKRGHEVWGLSGRLLGRILKQLSVTSDYSSVRKAARTVKNFKKPVTAVVNAAGVASMNLAVTTDESTVQKLIQTI